MKKSISILTALVMAVTMFFSVGTSVFAASTEGETQASVSYAVCEDDYEDPTDGVGYDEAMGYAAEGTASASQTCVISVTRNYEMAYAILDLVNQQRSAAGLKTLSMDKNLLNVAMLRAAETAVFYEHTRPDGTECYTADKSSPRNMFAENIAIGYNSAESVMTAWMNSEGHRTNILRSAAKSIGIGVVAHNGYIYYAQCFGQYSASGSFTKPANDTAKYTVNFVSQIEDYSLTPQLEVYDDTLDPGQVTTARMRMLNAKSPYTYAIFDNSSITYSVTDACVKIGSDGKLIGLKEGVATVKATTGGKTYTKSVTVTAPNKPVSGHVGQPVILYVSSAYDEAITTNKDYATVNIVSKTANNGAYNYKIEVTFTKALTSQTLSIKGANSSTLMTIAATISDHAYKDQTATPATCTTPGKTAGKICTICYQTTGDVTEIPALGHDIIIKPAVAATCTKTGKTEGQYCQRCNTMLVYQQTIPKTDHDITVTNNTDGSRVEACKNCSYKVTYNASGQPIVSTSDVTRIYGDDRYATSFKTADQLKSELGVSKFNTIIVAYGGNYADALAGSYLAAKEKAPILLINEKKANDVKTYIYENLKSGGKVYVLGGEAAVKSSWMTGIEYERLGGATRYETNLLILEEAGVDAGCKLMVCTGKGFADSLSVSATGHPILLVGNKLSSDQKAYMGTLDIDTIYLIGGKSAVNTTVKNDCLRYTSVRRLNGANRYETSVLVGYYLFNSPDKAVLAYAKNFPDGLSGGPLAYTLNAPLILTNTNSEAMAVMYTWDYEITSGFVLGGPGLISDNSVRTIFGMDSSDAIKVK